MRQHALGKLVVVAVVLLVLAGAALYMLPGQAAHFSSTTPTQASTNTNQSGTSTAAPARVLLDDNYYVGQTFNNCGPAALSMDLSFYGVQASQQELADILRPDNNTTGHDDDKSTSPDEIAAQAESYGLVAYSLPGGTIDLLKQLTAAGFPVMVRTLLNTSEDYAHYRVITGYDDSIGQITDEDGFQGAHISFAYGDFLALWKPFNYEYIVLASKDKQAELAAILGSSADPAVAWKNAAASDQQMLAQSPSDTAAEFDLSVALYHTGDYAGSVAAYEKAAPTLSEHALWYQLEPIESYYELGNYAQVFTLAQQILSDNNPAYPELYVLEGESYLKQGNTAAAKSAFQTALTYNKNLASAKQALASLQ